MVVVALVGHGDHFVVEDVSLLDADDVELGIDDAVDEVVSVFGLLDPLGVVLAETLPLALIDAEVEVSLDGVVEELELLPGADVSVEAVVVGGVVDAVVELGVLAPELL